MRQIAYFMFYLSAAIMLLALATGVFIKSYGSMLLTIIAACITINIGSLLAAYKAPDILPSARIIWISIGVLVLIIGFTLVDQQHQQALRDIGDIVGYPTAILSFPLGTAGYLVLSSIPGLRPDSFFLGTFFDWIVMMVFGYVQWFIFIPSALKALRRKRVH